MSDSESLRMIVDLPAYGGLLGMTLATLSADERLHVHVDLDQDGEILVIIVSKR